MKKEVSGDKINTITTIRKFRDVMIDLFKGYPAYEYFGIFETYFGKEGGRKIIEILRKDELIEVTREKDNEPTRYRLSAGGIKFTISMINLKHSERMLKYSNEMRKFTITIIILGALALFVGIVQAIFIYWQYLALL